MRRGLTPGMHTLLRHETCSGRQLWMCSPGNQGLMGTPRIAGLLVTGVRVQSYGIGSLPLCGMRVTSHLTHLTLLTYHTHVRVFRHLAGKNGFFYYTLAVSEKWCILPGFCNRTG